MDWASIIIAAISGGIGGGVGALLGALFGERLRSIVTVAFVVAAVVFLPRIIEPYLDPYLGATLRDATGQTAEMEKALDVLMSDPLYEAIIDGDPEKERELRERLTEAYRTGGETGLLQEAQKIGEEFGESTVFVKMPRAREQDIIAFFETSVSILRLLEFEDATVCYQWSYGAQYNDRVDPLKFDRTIGEDLSKKLVQAIVAVVKDASDMPVSYDRTGARLSVQQTATAVLGRLDQGPLEVVAGIRAANSDDEKRAVCRATGDMYAYILGLDNAADTFRELFTPQQDVISQLGFVGLSAIREVVNAGDPEDIFAGKDLGPAYSLR